MTAVRTEPAPATPLARSRRRLGVEEEFHLVDVSTRRLAPRAPQLLDELARHDGHYVAEMQRCVVEVNSDVVDDLDGLRAELTQRRRVLVDVASGIGLAIVAAGAVPLSVPSELDLTETPRFRQMLAEYQLLAREQLICGTQVHVDVADRDEAVVVAGRVAPWLPTLLALSASSPYWADGGDTGYASARTLVWQRWPTTGLSSHVSSAAEYDALVESLVGTGVISDPKMIYFDARPSEHANTLELRICDSCPSIDTILLIAALFRALVDREAQRHADGVPPVTFAPALGRAAVWRAARSGLEEDLVDLETGTHRRARTVVRSLVESLEPQLEANGDRDLVRELTESVLLAGSSASRQRRARRRRGRLTDVVDLLIAETAGSRPVVASSQASVFVGYEDDDVDATGETSPGPTTGPVPALRVDAAGDRDHDETFQVGGVPRDGYAPIVEAVEQLGRSSLRLREARIEDLQRADGVTFTVAGQKDGRVLPVDLLPRVISEQDWAHITAGAGQRSIALDAFLRDIYGDQQIVRDGVLPADVLDRAPGYRSTGHLGGRGVRAHINGLDLVRDSQGRWCVIEDNLRIPSGLAYAMWNRALVRRFLPEIPAPATLLDVDAAPAMLHDTLSAAAPSRAPETPGIAVLSEGYGNSAYAEHRLLADRMGVPLVRPDELCTEFSQVFLQTSRGHVPVHVLYTRIDEDMLLSSTGAGGAPLRTGLIDALHRGTLTLVNSFGNGVADDKAVYAYVPAMIDYYLGETPILHTVPTYICGQREHRDHVLKNVDSLVTKPIDGFGGHGVVIGPDASEATLEARREDLLRHPEQFIAQDVVSLSTHPTFDGAVFRPRHIDLRTFVHLRERERGQRPEAVVLPAALTRVGAAGSRIVNSSAGGGCKDTWILADPSGEAA